MTDPVTPDSTTPPVPPVAPAYAPAPVGAKTNTLAIVGFIVSFFVSLGGIIIGFIALSQIKRTGEGGRGFAIAGIIIGFVAIALTILFIIIGVATAGAISTSYSSY